MLLWTECTITDMTEPLLPSTSASQTPNPPFRTTKNSSPKKISKAAVQRPPPCLDKAVLGQGGGGWGSGVPLDGTAVSHHHKLAQCPPGPSPAAQHRPSPSSASRALGHTTRGALGSITALSNISCPLPPYTVPHLSNDGTPLNHPKSPVPVGGQGGEGGGAGGGGVTGLFGGRHESRGAAAHVRGRGSCQRCVPPLSIRSAP